MAFEKSIVGLDKIEIGDCGAAGVMGTSLAEVLLVSRGTVTLRFEEPGKTDLFIEKTETPYISIPEPNRIRQLEFSIRDVEGATLAKYFGGAVLTDKWSAPISESIIEQSIRITTKDDGTDYREIEIPRALIRASLDGKLVRDDTAIIKVIADVLIPLDAQGDPLCPITIEKKAVV